MHRRTGTEFASVSGPHTLSHEINKLQSHVIALSLLYKNYGMRNFAYVHYGYTKWFLSKTAEIYRGVGSASGDANQTCPQAFKAHAVGLQLKKKDVLRYSDNMIVFGYNRQNRRYS